MDEIDIDGYGRDYRPEPGVRGGDLAIRGGDRHVWRHDPLRGVAVAASGEPADVQLGVDPGTFYCADQFANLIEIAGAPATTVGFIHVPPDRSTGPVAAGAAHLYARSAGAEQCARVLATALRGISLKLGESSGGTIVLTGFGPFAGVADNPTAAFVADDAGLERMVALAFPGSRAAGRESLADARGVVGVRRRYARPDPGCEIRLVTAVLALAASAGDALAGRYFDTDTTAANFRRLLAATLAAAGGRPPAGIISLGVDSGQIAREARPAFRIETQTRGFHGAGSRGRTATDGFRRSLDLARIFMRARARGDDILKFS